MESVITHSIPHPDSESLAQRRGGVFGRAGWPRASLVRLWASGFGPAVDDFQKGAGVFCEEIEIPVTDGGATDQFAADTDGDGTGIEELAQGPEVDSAGRHQGDLWQGASEGTDVLGSAQVPGGEDLDEVCACLPCGDDLGWGEGAWGDGDA